ncbi:phosphotransferase family protein [Croceicoccus marinus]|uniref:Phosphotransferase n=1 Tax=Croceicoccus marinus TaxID=450378 RepID=A0A1Z1FG27_9SPHN|nr:phosphotransferase family protein [Croceicoccus marinus]ARU17685.1 phosphotransferase [Croceicoccus marinus]QNE07069.1 phosphotransferase family protein [Croceicoccus marinus]
MTPSQVRERLRDWLEANVDGWRNVRIEPLEVTTGSGFSAQIFFVDVEYTSPNGPQSKTLVVRRQPQDHEVVFGSSLELQGQMIAALDALGSIPVPEWIGMELDPAVLEMPFIVMGRVDGHAATQNPNYNKAGWLCEMSPDQRAATWRNAVEAFAGMAQIDWQDDGFGFMTRADWGTPGLDQYLGYIEAWYNACRKNRDMPYVDAAIDYIRKHQPTDTPVNVLWGDSTPSNVMFAQDGRVNALIDWELAALGPAELDLAWWLYFDDLFSRRFGVERLEGLPTRDETVAIWEAATGRKALHLKYYDVVVALRMALVVVGAFDRQVAMDNIPSTNKSLNANFMTLYLAERLGMDLPELGPDFYAFMSNMTPVDQKQET